VIDASEKIIENESITCLSILWKRVINIKKLIDIFITSAADLAQELQFCDATLNKPFLLMKLGFMRQDM
jgi:hypothetical protein